MGRVFSVHEYELRPEVDPELFEDTVGRAEAEGLFNLPGLVEYVFLRGIKGERRDRYTAIWVYEDRTAWERLWGSPGKPKRADQYPEAWQRWEQDFLAPHLQTKPDDLSFTSYEEVG